MRRRDEPRAPNRQISRAAIEARFTNERQVLFGVPPQGRPSGQKRKRLNAGKEPFATLDQGAHEWVEFDDLAPGVEPRSHRQVNEADQQKQTKRS